MVLVTMWHTKRINKNLDAHSPFCSSYRTVLLQLIPVRGGIMWVSGCVFKQVHTSCSSLRRTLLMTFSRARHEFSVFICKRKVCESHEVTISFSYTLTYTFAIILAQGPPVSPTQASCPPFYVVVFCTHVVCVAKGDEPRRFFAGTISTHSKIRHA